MNEYRYSKYLYKPKKKKKKFYIVIFLLILAGGGIYYGLTLDIYKIYSNIVSIYRVWFNDYRFIEKNLDVGDYNVVIHEGTPYLEKRPYNAKLMRYIGEAYYYISKSLTGVEREESINKAILFIRKGIVLSQLDEAITKNYFFLGMVYFDKGPHYYELAAEYLTKALKNGYSDNSIYEILGYSYYKMGVQEKAIEYLEKAKVMTPKEIVYLFLAYAYKNSGMYESAIKELDYLIDTASDDAVLEESFAARAWIDFHEERYEQARGNLKEVLDINQNSAYAHYWMGNIYEKEGDLISARKEWRIVLKIDPKHIGSIEKLY